MMHKFKSLTILFCAGALLFTFGCGGEKKPEGFPKLIKNCPFKLVQEGTPLAGAEVRFFGAGSGSDNSRWGIFGKSDEMGVVHLMTHKDAFKGAPAGTYKVTVTKDELTPSQYGEIAPTKGSELDEWQKKRMGEYRPGYHLVAAEQMDVTTTELEITIDENGATPDTLELGPAVREEFIPMGSAAEPGMSAEEAQELEMESLSE